MHVHSSVSFQWAIYQKCDRRGCESSSVHGASETTFALTTQTRGKNEEKKQDEINMANRHVPNANYIPLPYVGLALGVRGFALGAQGFALGARGFLDTNMLVFQCEMFALGV